MLKSVPLTKPAPRKSHEIAAGLRSLAKTLQPGDRMPSVPELIRDMGVAKTTAEAAVQALVQEGLLVRRRGSGTFVADPKMVIAANAVAVFTKHSNSFYDFCLARLNRLAAERDITLQCRYINDSLTPDDVLHYAEANPMGFLVIGAPQAWVARTLIESGRRAVVLGEPNTDEDISQNLPIPSIQADARAGGRIAPRHLLSLGHTRIAFMHRLPPGEMYSWERWYGHVEALNEAGFGESPREIQWETFEHWTQNPQLVRDYFSGPDAPTGIVVHSDAYAVHLMSVLAAAGFSVPQDVSVVGYDNLPLSETCWPTLTTVDQFLDEQIIQALQFLQGPTPSRDGANPVMPQLIVRRSSGPPPN